MRSEAELRRAVRESLAEDPVLSWRWIDTGPGDLLELRVDGRKLVFEAAFLLTPTARDVDRLQARVRKHGLLVIAPSISDVLVRHCSERGVSCLDMNGRQWVRSQGVVVDRHPSGGRRFRPALVTLDPFSPKSSRLVRALLNHPGHIWTQGGLAERTGLSPGLVSRLTRQLVREGLLAEKKRMLRLLRKNALLDAWAAGDDWSRRTAVQQYSLLDADLEDVARRVLDSLGGKQPPVFTQWFAANLQSPYTEPPVVSAYVKTFPTDREAAAFGARRVDDGGILWLIVPDDDGVFRETRQVGDFTMASDAQIYLDLLQVGLRGPEQARAFREGAGFREEAE